jgi:hypothetical protein
MKLKRLYIENRLQLIKGCNLFNLEFFTSIVYKEINILILNVIHVNKV